MDREGDRGIEKDRGKEESELMGLFSVRPDVNKAREVDRN